MFNGTPEEKIRKAKRLVFSGILLEIVLAAGMRIGFGPQELTGARATLAVFIGFPAGLFSMVLIVMGLLLYYESRREQADKGSRPSTIFKSRQQYWIGAFMIAFIYLVLAALNWHQSSPDSFTYPNNTFESLVIILGFVIAYTIYVIRMRRPWYFFVLGGNTTLGKPSDEREIAILHKASMYSQATTMLLSVGLLVVLMLFPLPSKFALFQILEAFIVLQFGLVSFYAWFFGWR